MKTKLLLSALFLTACETSVKIGEDKPDVVVTPSPAPIEQPKPEPKPEYCNYKLQFNPDLRSYSESRKEFYEQDEKEYCEFNDHYFVRVKTVASESSFNAAICMGENLVREIPIRAAATSESCFVLQVVSKAGVWSDESSEFCVKCEDGVVK